MKKILFVSFTSGWSGPTKSLNLLIKYFPRDKFYPVVMGPKNGPFFEYLKDRGVKVIPLPDMKMKDLHRLIYHLFFEKPDIVYGNNFSGRVSNAFLASHILGIPFILHVREMINKPSYKEKLMLRKSKAIIGVSNAVVQNIKKFIESSNLNLYTVYNGVDFENIKENFDKDCLKKLDTQCGEHKLIVSISHIIPRKGIEDIIEISGNLKADKVSNFRVLIFGSTERNKEFAALITKRIEEAGLWENIKLMGFVDDNVLSCVLSQASLYLHTSYKDPHPRSVIEAMGHGLPVVAYATDGVAETVVDGETGFLLRKGDIMGMVKKIKYLLNNPEVAKELGKHGKKLTLQKFNARNTAKQIEKIIESVG